MRTGPSRPRLTAAALALVVLGAAALLIRSARSRSLGPLAGLVWPTRLSALALGSCAAVRLGYNG